MYCNCLVIEVGGAMLGWCMLGAPAGRESGQVVVAQCDRRSVRESGT